ncbi:MAG: hypothetical protein ACRD2E_04920 [Terriglobales bacterium]
MQDAPRRVSRRAFGGRLLAVTGGAALAARAYPAPLPAGPAPAPAAAAPAAANPEAAIVEEKLRRVAARWGPRLSAAQLRRLRGVIAYHQAMLARIRAMPLSNADAPATVLKDRF